MQNSDDEEEQVDHSFLDIISPEFRTKLTSKGMVCETAWERSVLGKMMPPIMLREKLKPLHGLCTYKLLDQLRYGKYEPIKWDDKNVTSSDTVTNWFSELKQNSEYWAEKELNVYDSKLNMICWDGSHFDQWLTFGDELLALDRAIRVPNHLEEANTIFEAAKSVPEWVVGELRLESLGCSLDIEIQPIGSYVCGTKVIDIDEFDFFLKCSCKTPNISPETIELTLQKMINDKISSLDAKSSKAIIANWRRGLPNCHEPHITRTYKHGPAICVELVWLCLDNHSHELSIDMTVAMKDSQMPLKAVVGGLENSPLFHHVFDQIPDDEKASKIPGDFTSCVVDRDICKAMDDRCKNIMVVYRLLKVLIKHILPLSVYTDSSIKGHVTPPCLSSHNLKQRLIAYLHEHPNAEDWCKDKLHLRLAEVLRSIDISKIENDTALDDSLSSIGRKVRNKRDQIKAGLNERILGKHQENLRYLITLLESPYTKDHHEVVYETRMRNNIQLLFKPQGSDKLFPCDSDPYKLHDIALCSNATVYKMSLPEMAYNTHPLIVNCATYISNLYKDSPGIDLSQVDRNTFAEIWLLYSSGILSEKDLENENLCEARVNQLLKLYDEFGSRCPVLFACQHAMDQIAIVGSVMETLPNEYWDPVTLIPICLSNLSPKERAVVKNLAKRVVSTSYDISTLEIPKFATMSVHFQKIMISLQYMWAIQQRYAKQEGGQTDILVVNCDFMVDRISMSKFYAFPLTFILIWYILKRDWHYFSCVSEFDKRWAEWYLNKVVGVDLNCSSEIGQTIHENLFLSIHKRTSNKDEWQVVRIEYDFEGKLCLYRCIAAYGIVELRKANRSAAGMLQTFENEIEEMTLAILIRTLAERHISTFLKTGKDALETLAKSPYPSMSGRLQSLVSLSATAQREAGFLDLIAIAVLAKTQVLIFEDKCKNFIQTARFPSKLFANRDPICLLYSPGTEGLPGHFDLMLDNKIENDLWNVSDEMRIFDKYTSGVFENEKYVSMEEVMYNCMKEVELNTWEILAVEKDSDSLFRCIAAHMISSLQYEERDKAGILVRNNIRDMETDVIENIRKEVVRVIRKHENEDQAEIEHEKDKDYCCMSDRIATSDANMSAYAGYVQAAALAFLAKTQFHVYENNDSKYIQTAVVPQNIFTSKVPISLLYDHETDHYDLLLKKSRFVLKDAWHFDDIAETGNVETSGFARFADEATPEEKRLELKDILDPRQTTRHVPNKIVIKVVNDELDIFRCAAEHLIPDLQNEIKTFDGEIMDPELSVVEAIRANRIKSSVQLLLKDEVSNLRDKVDRWPWIKRVSSFNEYASVGERCEGLGSKAGNSGYLEMAAISFLCKCQVNLFEERSGKYLLAGIVGHGFYPDSEQLDIVFSLDKESSKNENSWRFNILRGESLTAATNDDHVKIPKYLLDQIYERDRKENERIPFIDLLDPSKTRLLTVDDDDDHVVQFKIDDDVLSRVVALSSLINGSRAGSGSIFGSDDGSEDITTTNGMDLQKALFLQALGQGPFANK